MIGETVSHYKILEKLGEGGMGIVYRAHDTSLDRDVALKFLPPHLSAGNEQEKQRFVLEAKAASALDHSNICTVHEIDQTDDGQLFIVMACYEGETLKKKLEREGRLPVNAALDITVQVAQGLAKAHEHGIIHRDIKPANIMLTREGVAKIVDFGLAKLSGRSLATRTGTTVGTAAYMSPEQARGEKAVDQRTDLWSLGVVVYELLTGQPPFPGDYEQAVLYSVLNTPAEPVTSKRTGVSKELERIITKCLEKKADERYQTAADLIADLKHLQRTTTRPSGSAEVTPKGHFTGGWHRWAIVAAIITIAAALVLIFWPFSSQPGQTTKSIAVLPFRNLSDSREDEYFSDGVTEDIITQLSYIAELKVISRTSIMQYKNTNKNIRDIAKELDVATVLEGTVRRANNKVRIVAQLIDATTDGHVWAQTYDEEMDQIFAIQRDVAQQIASALKAKLSTSENAQIAKKPTENITAYAYYLKGREYYNTRTRRGYESAIDLFKKALDLDHNLALAYAGLGDAYAWRAALGYPTAWRDSSIAMSSLAISIDPNLAEGYKALGLGYNTKGMVRKGLEMYKKAAELNPNYYPAILNIGFNSGQLGKLDEMLLWDKKALALNPTSTPYYTSVGMDYCLLGDDSMAMAYFRKAVSLEPEKYNHHWGLGKFYLVRGEYGRAAELAQKIVSLEPDDREGLKLAIDAEMALANYAEAERFLSKLISIDSTSELSKLGYVSLKLGRRLKAEQLFAYARGIDERALQEGNEWSWYPMDLARINAVEGNKAAAYEWLQKAIDAGWRDYRYARIDPLLEILRHDERFVQMTAKVEADVEEMRKHVEEEEGRER